MTDSSVKPLAFAAALAALPAAAHEVRTDSLVIDHPHTFETAATAMSGHGYMTITNTGDRPDRLIAVRADFPNVTLRGKATDADGRAGSVRVDGIEIAPGATIEMEPGGPSVTFLGLAGDPFEVGERILATLIFERAGEVEVEFWVEPRVSGQAGRLGPLRSAHPPRIDPTQAAAAEAALRHALDPGSDLEPLALVGDAAVFAWKAGGEAGRAFLRAEMDGWRPILLSGESLRFATTFRALGLSPRAASELADEIETAEAGLSLHQRAARDAFSGTVLLKNE